MILEKFCKLANPPAMPSTQIFRNSRAGSIMMEATSVSTPPTAIPTILKGSKSSQRIGYNTNASKATGQHKTKRMHQRRNLITDPPNLFEYRNTFRDLKPDFQDYPRHLEI
jgi:hypothetical protein